MTRDERGENWLGVPLGGLSHSVVINVTKRSNRVLSQHQIYSSWCL